MNKITVNGVSYQTLGNNMRVTTSNINNSKVTVNGVTIVDNLIGDITVTFEGDLASLDATNVVVNGDVKQNVDGTIITIRGAVGGNVDGTNITCGDVGGDVDGTRVTVRGSVNGKISM